MRTSTLDPHDRADYLQTPDDVDAHRLGHHTFDDDTLDELGDLTTNKPQVVRAHVDAAAHHRQQQHRLPDRRCRADLSDAATYADTGTLITPDRLSPVVGGSEDGTIKVNDLYAWLDLDDLDGDGLADGNGIPDMVAGGMVWKNSQGVADLQRASPRTAGS